MVCPSPVFLLMATGQLMPNNDPKGWLDQFLNRGMGPRPVPKSKHTVEHDKFDAEDYAGLLEEMREFSVAEDKLSDFVETGGSAYADAFYSLVKANPRLKPTKDIRPSHLVNRAVMGEAFNLTEHERLRTYTVGDEIGAALADVNMEPTFEMLFDKLNQESKMAQELQEHLDQLAGLEQEAADLDEMMKSLTEPDEHEDGEAPNFQEQAARIAEQIESMRQQTSEEQAALEAALGQQAGTIRATLRSAYRGALNDAEEMESLTTAWGLDPGALIKMPAEERIELARRLSNKRFKMIAELFGPMHRMAFAEQMRKTNHSRDEIYDIELGNDLARMLPKELLMLGHPVLKLDFYRRYYERKLVQYKLRGTERLAKGAIIFIEDGSGSMHGSRERWAKAVGLTLLQIAKSQNRPFYAIHFGGTGKMREFDFRNPANATIDQVIAFAETFFNGGTCFTTPLSRALDILRQEHAATGAVKADVVFATDGECGVDSKWLENFKAEQERISFRVYGIAIEANPKTEPFYEICDGRTCQVKDLVTGENIRDIFRSI